MRNRSPTHFCHRSDVEDADALVNVRSRQWAVGHGGFFTQEISVPGHRNDPVVLVFDCGSSHGAQSLQASVRQFAADLRLRGIRKVAQIVISHFDEDHASKLGQLAAALRGRRDEPTVEVALVVAPLLTPLARLRLAAKASAQAPAWYFDLLSDPSGKLRQAFPGALVSIRSLDDEEFVINDDLASGEGEDIEVQQYSSGRVEVSAGPGRTRRYWPTSTLLWEVSPWVTNAVSRASNEFDRSGVQAGDDEVPSLIRLLGTRAGRSILRDLVLSAPGLHDTNATSIVLYSGSPATWMTLIGYESGHTHRSAGVAWLGTADAYLKTEDQLHEFIAHYEPQRLNSVRVTSAPHHGSRFNSSSAFWRSMPNAEVATLHASGRHNLPDPSVVEDIGREEIRPVNLSYDQDHFDFCFHVEGPLF